MLRSLSARLSRWRWLLAALVALVGAVILALVRRRRPKLSTGSVAEALRRAHEADVEATLAKAKLDREAEEEIAEIRSELAEEFDEIEVRATDRRAKLAGDPDKLIHTYRKRAFDLGLRDQY